MMKGMATAARSRKSSLRLRRPVLAVRDNIHFPAVIQNILVGRERSVKAIEAALADRREVLVVGQLDPTEDDPGPDDLFGVGTLSEVLHVLPLPDGTLRVVLRGIARVQMNRYEKKGGVDYAHGDEWPEACIPTDELEALAREAVNLLQRTLEMGLPLPPEVLDNAMAARDPGVLADLIAHHLPLSQTTKFSLLECQDARERLDRLVHLLAREAQVLTVQSELRDKVEREIGATQREYLLREQLRAIQSELGTDEALSPEGLEYRSKIEAAQLPAETEERAMQEVRRLERAPANSPESMVIRTYLDWLVALPWNNLSQDRVDVKRARAILDRDHYGLEQVKDRILDFLAVRQISGSLRGPILCFVGPPGVGKTSLGRSIAEALGRQFQRISLGGVRDEAEIRGHRRTYVGSMPGRLIHAIKQSGTRNPVIVLDEVDKMAHDFRGDPNSALLEALDPEQNGQFSDHYIEAPFDLSAVMFICTANLVENLPPALRDRMEVIRFPGYTEAEKVQIAKQYLLPKKAAEHGLKKSQVSVGAGVLEQLCREYTREAGVRNLEREVATLCRKVARRIAEDEVKKVQVGRENLSDFVGAPRFRYGVKGKRDEVGAATGLVVSEHGGDLVTIEVVLAAPYGEEPKIQLTGSLGDVMKESALAALTYVRSHPAELGLKESFRSDVHLHVPEGAVPKDGPSAGVTILVALVSAATGRPVRRDVAMTGEVTLRGHVLPVGGVREKVLAAHRAGIHEVIVPRENARDLDLIPDTVRETMTYHLVERAEEVLPLALRSC